MSGEKGLGAGGQGPGKSPPCAASGGNAMPLLASTRGVGLLGGLRTRTATQRRDEPVAGRLVLAIDTTHEFGSLALARGAEIVEEVLLCAPSGFGHVLYPHLKRLLDRHAIALEAIDCFAAASGPGSFTGVRVGLACVKGLAEALGKPAVGVSNLQALATFAFGPLRAAVIDARRGEVYGAVYDWGAKAVTPEVVAKFPAWLETLPAGDLEFVSTDFTPFRNALAGTRFEKARIATAPPALASAIARLAMARLLSGSASDPAALDANYVRRSDAELFWKE
ncbi:MAG: tRNA (adenosine(37)-N6)-threonylcarbamoyltransferase complex dimerization subunit type 1 TsaB [Acidobacteriia bacterium]|nr:tRNA (adenosine(37)-N6)-threonylcarbamoyltransferase complex dimerization subunit type 1 TsaB [Terriglobia bacterium]